MYDHQRRVSELNCQIIVANIGWDKARQGKNFINVSYRVEMGLNTESLQARKFIAFTDSAPAGNQVFICFFIYLFIFLIDLLIYLLENRSMC